MGYLRKPNKLGVICNSASDLPAIGPHPLLLLLRIICTIGNVLLSNQLIVTAINISIQIQL